MSDSRLRQRLEELLEPADIRIGGSRPWDIQVHNPDLYARVWGHGTLGVGEAYMDGWWDCERLDEMIARAWRADVPSSLHPLRALPAVLRARLINLQKGRRAFEIGRRHYDKGNALYECMLGRRMVYSCAYWKDAANLDDAQEAKLELVARKLGLEPGMRVLDIGCGWGGALAFMVERYGITGVGITVSEQQVQYARKLCADMPIEIRLQDYRDVDGQFDRIFSIGMFEHVGVKNYAQYFSVVRRSLSPDGVFLLHSIGGNKSADTTDPWVSRYIFPNSMLPSARQITTAVESQLVIEDWHNFGADYDRTLMCWYENFENAWSELGACYDERFRRMWRYYLLAAAGAFRARMNQVWQLVFTRDGIVGGYRPEGIR